MDSSTITGYGKPENTTYDKVRHESMKLRPIGYGYFHTNRSVMPTPVCEMCKEEIQNPVRFHNKKPYHVECYRAL